MFAEYKGETCCWCVSAPPDSREHRFKKSDLVQQFGRGPYIGRDETVAGTNDGDLVPVQGPGSSRVKLRPNLCRKCNGARSQPFDRAWATFTGYVTANEDEIVETRAIDLRGVFDRDWEAQAENVSKYAVKHAICRLAQWQVLSPEPIRGFLDGGLYPDCLALDAEIRTDILAFTRGLRDADIPEGSLWNGPPTQVLDENGEPERHPGIPRLQLASHLLGLRRNLGGYPNPFASPVLHLTEGYEQPPEEVEQNFPDGLRPHA